MSIKCPFRMRAFDMSDECDPECAWRIRVRIEEGPMGKKAVRFVDVCAVAMLASECDCTKGCANWNEEEL